MPVVISSTQLTNKGRMAILSAAIVSSSEVILLPPHMKQKEMEVLKLATADYTEQTEVWDKQSKRDRTHPNEPFYRKFQKRRKW